VQLIKESISVVLSTPEGEVIPYVDKTFKEDVTWGENEFQQVYRQNLPDHLIETISFTLRVNDKLVKVIQKYPLERQLHYTFWDQLMGV
jgi:hypothetical protein